MLQCLLEEKVEFLRIGAYALAVHGYPRATKDLDIWVRAGRDNTPRILRALAKFGAPLAQVHVEVKPIFGGAIKAGLNSLTILFFLFTGIARAQTSSIVPFDIENARAASQIQDPIIEVLFFDHPSGSSRIRNAMEWKKSNSSVR